MNKEVEELFKKCSEELNRLSKLKKIKMITIDHGYGHFSFKIERIYDEG